MTQLDVEQSKQVVTPLFLIELAFSTLTVRYSTRQTVTYNGFQYAGEQGVSVISFSHRDAGAMSAQIQVPNQNRAMSSLILNQGTNRVAAKIHKAYGTGTTLTDEVVMPIFDGMVESAPQIGDVVVLSLITENILTQYSPRILCGPPVFNHIPPSGTIITWGGEQYELVRQ